MLGTGNSAPDSSVINSGKNAEICPTNFRLDTLWLLQLWTPLWLWLSNYIWQPSNRSSLNLKITTNIIYPSSSEPLFWFQHFKSVVLYSQKSYGKHSGSTLSLFYQCIWPVLCFCTVLSIRSWNECRNEPTILRKLPINYDVVNAPNVSVKWSSVHSVSVISQLDVYWCSPSSWASKKTVN